VNARGGIVVYNAKTSVRTCVPGLTEGYQIIIVVYENSRVKAIELIYPLAMIVQRGEGKPTN
jgi:hypothetical protein